MESMDQNQAAALEEDPGTNGIKDSSANTMDTPTLSNIDDDQNGAKLFFGLVALMELMGLVCFILVLIWTERYLGGFKWDGSQETFNYHPVFMILGMVITSGNAAVAYRVLRKNDKFKVKLIHAGLHILTFIFTLIGLIAVFDFHNTQNIPNMYSLHSWIGLTTVLLYSCQILVGFLGFLFPKFNEVNRRKYLMLHVFFGGAMFALAIVACISGITEKMLFKYVKIYPHFPSVGIVANMLGYCLVLFALLVGYIIYNPQYARVDKYEHLE